ncbi:MAG: hypothetical protein ABI824_01210 [Acidobacteriota bacterium]
MRLFRPLILPAFLLMAGVLSAQPVITQVLDGAALTANIAQGSVFIVKGTNLSNAGFVQATAPTYPTQLNNVSVSLTPTAGGNASQVLMVYTYNLSGVNQLSLVLQSTVATGSYNLRVTSPSGTSAPFAVTVVQRKPGIVSAAGDGQGIAQATLQGALILQRTSAQGKIGDFDTRPAHPNDIVTLWMTGLGPDAAADSGTGTSGDLTSSASIRVVFDGADIVPGYAGRSFGYPGLDQVNFTIPNGVVLNCTNTVQVRAGGVLSNQLTIATSAATSTACPPPLTGGGGGSTNLSPTQTEINTWIAAGKFRSGSVTLSRTTAYTVTPSFTGGPSTTTSTRSDDADASFSTITGPSSTLLSLFNGSFGSTTTIGACTVTTITSANTNPFPGLTSTSLDAGTPITISGPNGTKSMPRQSTGSGFGYSLALGTGVPGSYLDAGTYTATVPGSSTVAGFSGSISVPSEITWTNRASLSTVTRGSNTRLTWSGGDSTSTVSITGSSSSINTTTSAFTSVSFSCTAKNSDGGFTIPASVLTQLPATSAISAGGITIYSSLGQLAIDGAGSAVRVSVNGLDYATISSDASTSQSTIYQ